MSSQFLVTDQAGRWGFEGWRRDHPLTPSHLPKKKILFLFCCWPPSLSGKVSGDSLLPVHSSLHRWLPGRYAYLLIMLQGLCLTGIPYREAGWQHSQVKLHTDGFYHWLFSSKHKCGVIFLWVQVLGLISVFFLNVLQGLSELLLTELKCKMPIVQWVCYTLGNKALLVTEQKLKYCSQ